MEANRTFESIDSKVAVLAGAGCLADSVATSHLLNIVGVQVEWAKGTLRLITGRMTTAQEVDRAAAVIVATVQQIRKNSSS